MATDFSCLLCGDARTARTHIAREMMYGTRAAFTYLECAGCQSLQIERVPADLAQHYPADYYSYDAAKIPPLKQLRQFVRHNLVLFAPAPLSAWATGNKSDRLLPLLRQAGVRRDSRILDIGCGGGALLRGLARAGLPHLLGADPFIGENMVTPEGVAILKRSVREVQGRFDIMMFNHSLEHVNDPAGDLAAALALLTDEGCCLVRTPIVGTFAWREYGIHWYGIDAPRHLVLPSVEGMKLLATRVGFEVESATFDSNAMQFIASELYRRDIPLCERKPSHFSRRQVAEFKRRAELLNAAGDGDQCAFFLRKTRVA